MTVHDETMKLLLAGLDRPVIQNAVRSMYVEYQVAVLLGEEWQLVGTDWGGWDFQSRSGHRLELKQAAAKQSWAQTMPSKGVFDIASRTGHYEGATWIGGAGRFADVYVFAWHGGWDDSTDQRDETQWQYFVVPTLDLPIQRTISLSRLRRLIGPTTAASLSAAVAEVARSISIEAR